MEDRGAKTGQDAEGDNDRNPPLHGGQKEIDPVPNAGRNTLHAGSLEFDLG